MRRAQPWIPRAAVMRRGQGIKGLHRHGAAPACLLAAGHPALACSTCSNAALFIFMLPESQPCICFDDQMDGGHNLAQVSSGFQSSGGNLARLHEALTIRFMTFHMHGRHDSDGSTEAHADWGLPGAQAPGDPYAMGMQLGGKRVMQRYIGACNIQVPCFSKGLHEQFTHRLVFCSL